MRGDVVLAGRGEQPHGDGDRPATPGPPVLDPVLDLVLDPDVWRERERRHAERAAALTGRAAERRARGEAHPVEDFLYTYYSWAPGKLLRWHPGVGVVLAGADERAGWANYETVPGGVRVDAAGLVSRRRATVRLARDVLVATRGRAPQLACFGLHEWAMVHRTRPEEVRHAGLPLRLGHEGTDAVVDSHRIRCTHHDAFRFFTPTAVPLNEVQPTRQDQAAQEQPGCLHATMDLYRWAMKLSPAVPGELLLDCFELAGDVRVLDMRASPYDVSSLGLDPVRIETAEGKAQYARAQREFAQRADPLRAALAGVCEALLRA
ncbi:3-methyladenine DNA glycosylase [Kineococcus sp. LSe6-4]|uniref:3-methyladenine DNA glycosylase n=1 Tax=Kineococcus halophytocola TaxID=3234027 RepID=A0ABV4H6M7_9ACTN